MNILINVVLGIIGGLIAGLINIYLISLIGEWQWMN